ncbi:ATP synthase F1 subunit delta [Lacipirellula limnantheis]|uniref:ATP synthase subunit delta n=1 Tax=Lacipirellula limnantheis TaxID=2528024 RepID=A0A517U083_9BACT|nr:ATP synthase F1 subunit delta [Lacipirellula limnantheis]QDT74015.1 ATP synthase subunit delta, sodium ion specific [Lacipirellula limnantheis]
MAEFIHTDRVRDTVFDVDAERLAGVYASAGLDAAGGIGEQEQVVNELEAIVGEVLSLDSRLQQILASVLIAAEEKVSMLDRLFQGKVSTTTLNLLKVMARHKRLSLLRDVAKVSRKLWQARSGRIPVELETANPLDATLEKEILVAFGDVLGADPIVTQRVNPDLIAGFVIRVGDRVYDGSVRTRLERMRLNMIERAVDAIQRNPRQFLDKTTA